MRVVVMAKSPRPGMAKTRLAPTLGEAGAAGLAARMLAHTLAEAVAAGVGAVELCGAPGEHDTLLREAAARAGVAVAAQGEGGLGTRLARAAARALAVADGTGGAPGVLLLGTDAPALDAAALRAAAAALNVHDAVLVPAHDGGYALIGLKRALPVFDGIAWSTPAVLQQTQQALARCGARVALLPAVHDIDEPADLVHLPKDWREQIDSWRR